MTIAIQSHPREPAAFGIRLKIINGRLMAQPLDAEGNSALNLPVAELTCLPCSLITRCAGAGRAVHRELSLPLTFLLAFDFVSRTWREWIPLQSARTDGVRLDLSPASLAGLPPTSRVAGTFTTTITGYRDINESLTAPPFDGVHFTQTLENFLSMLVARERVEGAVYAAVPEDMIAIESAITLEVLRQRLQPRNIA